MEIIKDYETLGPIMALHQAHDKHIGNSLTANDPVALPNGSDLSNNRLFQAPGNEDNGFVNPSANEVWMFRKNVKTKAAGAPVSLILI